MLGKRAAERVKEKDDASKEETDKKELVACVATMGSTHLPPLCLFMAWHVSAPTQRAVNSTTSTQTMCRKHDLFNSCPPLLFSCLATPGNGKTIPVQDVGDTPKWASMPLIAGNRVPHEAVPPQLNKLKLVSLDGENQQLAKTSTDGLSHLTVDEINLEATKAEGLACGTGPQCNKIHLNSPGQTRVPTSAMEGPDGLTTHAPVLNHDGEAVNVSGRTSVTSDRRKLHQQGVSIPKFKFGDERFKADVRSDEKRTNDEGLTYQRVPRQPLDAPTQNMPPKGKVDGYYKWKPSIESSGGPTTQAPGPKQLEDAVNESVNPSNRSDRDGSCHQGDSKSKLEFGGEEIKTEVRKDAKWMNGDGNTSQRVPWQPLEPPTRIAPPTGKTDDLQGPTCSQNGHSRRNNLGTCENGCQRAVKERKGQLSAKGIKSSPCPVETDENKSCSAQHSTKATMESCDLSHMVNAHDNSTRGLTTLYNAPAGCCDLRSKAAPDKINQFLAHPFEESVDPRDSNANKMDDPLSRTELVQCSEHG